jgi:hypothetical protein
MKKESSDGTGKMRDNIPGESERVPLEVGNLGAGEEDILSRTRRCLFLLNLDLHHI